MNSVKVRRTQKSMRLSLHAHHPFVVLLTCGWLGHLPVIGKNTHLGSLSVSLITPFLMWPLAKAGNLEGILIIITLATAAGTYALMHIKRKEVETDHDSRAIVLDEFAGAALLATMLPLLFNTFQAVTWVQQFPLVLLVGILFRVLDISKLYPVNILDTKWHHPFSVMADDLAAAVQGILLLAGLAFLVPLLLG